ncbi:MAG: 23S rRNA (adenine(2503)-C(2))-methyltransferase RlmN [Acidimicrobiia bacterium]|nr:23S rRNA (adenine(2503)-C(2))-methyltransferase RlmN [Acidimicrobiia bacterium]
MPERASLADLDRSELASFLSDEPRFRTKQVWTAIHEKSQRPAEISTIPLTLRSRLERHFPAALSLVTSQTSRDGRTTKALFALDGGAQIEAVLMRYNERATVCVSSQAGCAMACSFCATGQAGFERNLSVSEILEQVHWAKRSCTPQRLSNVVFMGMGEPLANLDRLLAAIDRVTADIGIGARKVTVSTVGIIPAMESFAAEKRQVGLAVSLHAANDDLRSELVPINRRYPIADLVQACRLVRAQTGRRVSFEWAMIEAVNDGDSDARELAAVARSADAHVNLIPLNATPGYPTTGSSPERVKRFARQLRSRGINVTVRATMGDDIDAACGQLATRHS